jgi:predicted metal-dependent enzyme (double-stranded beta helix superfamily)
MRAILSALSLFAATSAQAQAQTANFDAVTAAPSSHRVLFEDEKIRVLRVEIAPGATEPVHDHRWPSVMYFEQPQPIMYTEYKLVKGRPVEVQRVEAPALKVTQTVRGGPEGLHAVTNRGTAAFVVVRVEFKSGSAASAK